MIQKGLVQDIPTDIPHPIVVDAGRVQGNGPWGAQALVLSLKSLFGEGWGRIAEKPGVSDGLHGVLKSARGHPKGQDKCAQGKNLHSLP